jgi:hypothetical protein
LSSNHTIAAVIVLLGLMAGRSSAAPPIDPCTLLTSAQVSSALGVTVGASDRMVPTLCQWAETGKSPVAAKKLTVTLQDPRAFANAKMPVGRGITKTPVSGVGDDAVSGTSPAGTTLTVKKGDTVFVIHVWGFPIDETKTMEKTFALQVLSKL